MSEFKEKNMKVDEAFEYIVNRALAFGYTQKEIECFAFEIRERLSMMECDVEDLNNLFEELF